MKKADTIFLIGTIGCVVMALVCIAVAMMGIGTGNFPLGYEVEAFTSNKIGALILFLAAAADIVSVILTQIVNRNYEKVSLISKGTIVTGMAFVALIFVFQQRLLPIALWLLGAAASVAALSACSDIAKPRKDELG